MSLVSVYGRNWTQTAEIEEIVEKGEIIETANSHAVFAHVIENMVGCRKRLGEYPTLSATKSCPKGSMILRKVEQVRRVLLIFAGFTLLLAGAVMMVTPGPGMLLIFLGLG